MSYASQLQPHMRARAVRTLALTLCGALASICLGCGGEARSRATIDWPLSGNASGNTHFASLTQIDRSDVGDLRLAWTRPEGFGLDSWETFPVVVGSTMFYSTDTDEVVAVRADTGRELWSYTPQVEFLAGPQGASANPVSRGVAVGAGRVYELTADDQLIALSASSGRLIWDVRIADPAEGYIENSAGTLFDGEIVIGGPAGDGGLRGFVAAYDTATGRQVWRTYMIPAAGSGWRSDSPASGGGDVWMSPTIDPSTSTVFVATGNPTPAFSNATRRGCDPWTDATVALDARTGAVEWAHSELCNDSWDYDTDQAPILLQAHVDGRSVAAVGDGSKAGFYSILNARTGSLIARSPELTRYSLPHITPTRSGSIACPGIFGGLEYGPPAYDAGAHSVYVPGINMCMRYTVDSASEIARHRPGGPDLAGTAVQVGAATGVIACIDADTGAVRWRTLLPRPAAGGALATAAGLVFAGDDDGYLYALDGGSGRILWRAHLGLRFGSAPIAYEVDGTEYLAVAAGGSALSVPGDAPQGEGRMFVFTLAGR